jgi:hypothetical protein
MVETPFERHFSMFHVQNRRVSTAGLGIDAEAAFSRVADDIRDRYPHDMLEVTATQIDWGWVVIGVVPVCQ